MSRRAHRNRLVAALSMLTGWLAFVPVAITSPATAIALAVAAVPATLVLAAVLHFSRR